MYKRKEGETNVGEGALKLAYITVMYEKEKVFLNISFDHYNFISQFIQQCIFKEWPSLYQS
jgi:hypothetical protein